MCLTVPADCFGVHFCQAAAGASACGITQALDAEACSLDCTSHCMCCRANHRLDLDEVELPENHPWATRKPVSGAVAVKV